MIDVYVAAGSNVEPQRHLRTALAALRERFGTLRCSPAYRNQAVGFQGDDFINLVVGFATDEPVEDVRAALRQIESLCGRPPQSPRWAPRTMDLDVLLYGDLTGEHAGMTLPRPDLVRRAYMLKPLADIAPQLLHPTLGQSIATLWQAFAEQHHPLVVVPLE